MTQTTLAVSGNWLDANIKYDTTTNAMTSSFYPSIGDPINTQVTVWPLGPTNWPSYYYSYSGPARPIKLTLSEVERLRAAAKRDAKLKAILAKFTDQIEITVDFE